MVSTTPGKAADTKHTQKKGLATDSKNRQRIITDSRLQYFYKLQSLVKLDWLVRR
jgi:hypothetical protein